tara:strand:- start:6 stop:233 length:228 start_codon:yes stop_codon:yes gene_type:complete
MSISEIKSMIEDARSEFVMEKVKESLPYDTDIESILIKALEDKGYFYDGGGYDFQTKKRDLFFVAPNDETITITI